jgi:hypothetical protein
MKVQGGVRTMKRLHALMASAPKLFWLETSEGGHQQCTALELATWFAEDPRRRRVGLTRIGDLEVSTVFLGINHAHTGNGQPVLYETMVCRADGSWLDVQERYCLRVQAEAGHAEMVARVEAGEFELGFSDETEVRSGDEQGN